jgi:uncharacterized membrane protein
MNREATGGQQQQNQTESLGTHGRPDVQYGRGADTGHSGRTFEEAGSAGYAGIWAGLAGLGIGILGMYFLDHERGRRRRALLSDKFASAGHEVPDALGATARDISNRARGVWAEATRLFSSDDPSDQVVEARIRAKLGRVISHPHAIHVASRNGNVTLDGVILAREVPELIKAVMGVRGVKTVDSRVQEHTSPQGIPSLQSGGSKSQTELTQENWSPALRVAAGAAGLGLSAAGVALLAKSASNIELQRLFGFGGGRTAITIDKSINVDAPPDVVYALWSNFENFPQFMTNVLEVRNINDRLSHWKVAGPAGIPVEWDAETTRTVPNEMIAWKSVDGSTVANAGYVLFEPNDKGGTEVTVRISYDPPAGAFGHAIAKAFGADPKSEMDQDLMRMKTLLETGHVPHDAAQTIFSGDRDRRIH